MIVQKFVLANYYSTDGRKTQEKSGLIRKIMVTGLDNGWAQGL